MASFLPVRDAQLLAWSVNFNALINSTRGEGFDLTRQQATDYTTKHTAFATAYQTAYDPNTRTPPNITIKDEAEKALSEYAIGPAASRQIVPSSETARVSLAA